MAENKKILKTALFIENEIIKKKIIKDYLLHLDYQVVIVDTSENAIQLVQTKTYDLILIDLDLPEQSGEAIIHEVRISNLNKLTALIVLTAYKHAEIQKKCLVLGVDGVLIKPISKEALEKNILRCTSKDCVESNLAAQFQIEWINCKELLEINPLLLPNKKAISDFINRFKILANKAICTLESYQKWVI